MIDHRNSLIVIRNPKAASTTLRVALSGEEAREPWKHSHLEQYSHLTPGFFPSGRMATYISIVTVRHPVDRAVSLWHFFKAKSGFRKYESILDWAKDECPAPVEHFKNERKKGCEVMDQCTYVEGVDIVIPINRMLPKVNRVRALVNLPALKDLPHCNRSTNGPKGRPTDDLKKLLLERFHNDMVMFEKWK